jgi:hypothetical protein
MTTPPSSRARCDRILALIDDCLADFGHQLLAIEHEYRNEPPIQRQNRSATDTSRILASVTGVSATT